MVQITVILSFYVIKLKTQNNSKINLKYCVLLEISYQLYFLHISQVWSMLHDGSVGRVQSKESYVILTYQKICVFIIFVSFFSFFFFLIKYQISATEY